MLMKRIDKDIIILDRLLLSNKKPTSNKTTSMIISTVNEKQQKIGVGK